MVVVSAAAASVVLALAVVVASVVVLPLVSCLLVVVIMKGLLGTGRLPPVTRKYSRSHSLVDVVGLEGNRPRACSGNSSRGLARRELAGTRSSRFCA